MSVDAVVYINRIATEDELDRANRTADKLLPENHPRHSRSLIADWSEGDPIPTAEELLAAANTPAPYVQVIGAKDGWTQTHIWTPIMYFGPGYVDRYPWPPIRQVITVMQAIFPEDAVYYGTAGNPDVDPVANDHLLGEHDALWADVLERDPATR